MCLFLAAYNNLVATWSWHRRHYVAANAAATAGLLIAARAHGLTADDIGLRGEHVGDGVRAGAVVAEGTAAFLTLALLVPRSRPLLRDARLADLSRRGIAWHAAVRVPVGTAMWEEVAFRGVLLAALRRALPLRRAVVADSLVFGVWHVRPAVEAHRMNQRAGSEFAAAAGSVVATAAAGAGLCWLRLRSGSLAAPFLAHASVNSLGTLAAATALRLGSTRDHRGASDSLHARSASPASRAP